MANVANMLSSMVQLDLRFRDGKFAGAYVILGMGIFNAFFMFRLGHDSLIDKPVMEVGLTVKIPVWGWK